MTTKKRVTIKDVARLANVTPQTVSRALRNTHDISEETKNRILAIAEEIGYIKNSTATALRSGRAKLIAVIYDNLINFYFSVMTEYIRSALGSLGYSFVMISVSTTKLDKNAYISALSQNAEGIISFLEPEEELGATIDIYRVPVMLLGRRTNVKNVGFLYMDDVSGGRLAAERLAKDGCKKVMMISEPLEISCAFDRHKGFEEECVALGLGVPEVISPVDMESKLKNIFSGKDKPDGIFCFNDIIAFEVLSIFERNGIAPVKLIGYDNLQSEIRIPLRLTSIGTDKRAMAFEAAEKIVDMVENGYREWQEKPAPQKVFLAEGTTA